jgi:hypothetical protein
MSNKTKCIDYFRNERDKRRRRQWLANISKKRNRGERYG